MIQNIEERIKACMSVGNLTKDIQINLGDEEQEKQMQQEIVEEKVELQKKQDSKKQLQESTWEIIDKDYQSSVFKLEKMQKKTFANLCEAFEKLQKLHTEAQELTRKFSNEDTFIPRFFQAIKITFIGIMQLEQIGLILDDKDIINKSISEEYDIQVEKKNLNQTSLNMVLEFIIVHVLSHLAVVFQKVHLKREKYELRQIVIYLSKLQSCLEQLPGAALLDINDIFCYERSHYRWQALNSVTSQVILGSKDQINKSYANVAQGLLLANAMISKGSEFDNQAAQQIMQGFGAIYYLLAKKDAKIKADHFMAEPKKNNAFKAWNLGESGMLGALMPLLFPNITYNKKIFIPYLFKRLVKDNIQRQYANGTINKILNDGNECQVHDVPQYQELYTKDKTRIPVRILCHYNLQEIKSVSFMQDALKFFQGKKVFESLIFHIHGGGFVSMSSRSHQTYTRKWAKELQVPIFSVDYRKAPDHPYPYGIDDCWQVYMFILTYIERYFNIKPKKIVLTGDSAGGNLVAALTVQIIKAGVRIPDGILMSYPALSLDVRQFTPSSLISLNDPLLHHTVLKLCLESYIPKDFNANIDPLISPSLASDEILSRFPPTRIVLGTNDPLHDESFRLANKLLKLNRDVKIIEYQWMPHGFLQFDVIQGMKESEQTVKDACNILKELIK